MCVRVRVVQTFDEQVSRLRDGRVHSVRRRTRVLTVVRAANSIDAQPADAALRRHRLGHVVPRVVADWSTVVGPRDLEQVDFLDVGRRRAVELGVVQFVDGKRSRLDGDLRLV